MQKNEKSENYLKTWDRTFPQRFTYIVLLKHTRNFDKTLFSKINFYLPYSIRIIIKTKKAREINTQEAVQSISAFYSLL